MNSAELNEAISKLDDPENQDRNTALCDDPHKIIPYIGWCWRCVDFDAPTYSFGIIPSGTPEYTATTLGPDGEDVETGPRRANKYVGFMENNKWDYPYTRETTPEEWAEIKRLIIACVQNPTQETVAAVHAAINAIAET